MGRKRRAESRWWGHRPLDFSNFLILADDCVGEHESIASVMSGPTFSLLGDESQSICVGNANPSQGESNLGHANVAPDVRVLSDKGKEKTAEHCSVDENVKLKGKEKMAKHCSGDENVSKKRKFIVDAPNPPCESISQTASETVRQKPDELVSDESDMKICPQFWCKEVSVRQVHDDEDEVLHFLVSGAKLRFGLGEFSLIIGLKCKDNTYIKVTSEVNRLVRKYFKGSSTVTWSQLESYFLNEIFKSDADAMKIAILYFVHTFLFSMLKTKVMDMSYFHLVGTGDFNGYPWGIDVFYATFESCSNKFKTKPGFYRYAPTNADLKKEFNDFRLRVDVKFGDILQALGDLTKKLEGGNTVFPDLGMDVDEDTYKVAPDSTPNVCEVGVGGEKTNVVGGGVHVGESSGDVNMNEQVSQPDFSFVSMHESVIASMMSW
ncbi:hypothetical protein HAX54_028621 [Datura stramonium]|uniref:DUF1985 domain-containing protein n=1 Tax=Datura stramonium TaxID=4076 RepID=A0ABS8V4U3_DATST|nr:hypothetical protein [Datura stramonium]